MAKTYPPFCGAPMAFNTMGGEYRKNVKNWQTVTAYTRST